MHVFPEEWYIMRLKGTIPPYDLPEFEWARALSVEYCVQRLKAISGLDFGADGKAWAKWWRAERKRRGIHPDF